MAVNALAGAVVGVDEVVTGNAGFFAFGRSGAAARFAGFLEALNNAAVEVDGVAVGSACLPLWVVVANTFVASRAGEDSAALAAGVSCRRIWRNLIWRWRGERSPMLIVEKIARNSGLSRINRTISVVLMPELSTSIKLFFCWLGEEGVASPST